MIEQLRQATRQSHTRLDHTIYPIIQSIHSAEDYARLLQMFYGYFKPVYDGINTHIDTTILPDYEQRRKPSVILDDLALLPASKVTAIFTGIPPINTTAQAFGALYVLEGSTMGGTFISKKLKENTGLDNEAFRFFNGYGNNNPTMWAAFIQSLEHPSLATEEQPLVETAIATFDHFYNWVNTCYSNKAIPKTPIQAS